MPELWKRWNYEYLDPPDSLKAISQEDKPKKPEKSALIIRKCYCNLVCYKQLFLSL